MEAESKNHRRNFSSLEFFMIQNWKEKQRKGEKFKLGAYRKRECFYSWARASNAPVREQQKEKQSSIPEMKWNRKKEQIEGKQKKNKNNGKKREQKRKNAQIDCRFKSLLHQTSRTMKVCLILCHCHYIKVCSVVVLQSVNN